MSIPVLTPTLQPTIQPTVATSRRMSYAEWLAWEHTGLSEWIQGEVIQFMATTDDHQKVLEFLHHLIDLFAQIFNLGRVHLAPYAMRVKPAANGREPDLLFVANAHLERLTREQLEGPADLVIEVVSDGSVYNDRVDKFQEYEEGGVREYWIVDPRPKRKRVDFYLLDAHGQYRAAPIDASGIYHTTVLPGFWLKVDWLWAERPNALAALAEMMGAERLLAAVQAAHHE